MADSPRIAFPTLRETYVDEYGPIEEQVYTEAVALWPQAEQFAIRTLGDPQIGINLMYHAAAIVSRILVSEPDKIQSVPGYLFVTYKRLVLAELKKQNSHRLIEEGLSATTLAETSAHSLEQKILIEQIRSRMEPKMKKVFELLVLGYSFEEIGPEVGMKANVLRSYHSKQIQKIIKEFQ